VITSLYFKHAGAGKVPETRKWEGKEKRRAGANAHSPVEITL
jgi:hypothetical protein